jgi:hypothetical protein
MAKLDSRATPRGEVISASGNWHNAPNVMFACTNRNSVYASNIEKNEISVDNCELREIVTVTIFRTTK